MREEQMQHSIDLIEQNYVERLTELVEQEEYGDAHSLFEEFVIDGDEPDKYLFVKIKSGEIVDES